MDKQKTSVSKQELSAFRGMLKQAEFKEEADKAYPDESQDTEENTKFPSQYEKSIEDHPETEDEKNRRNAKKLGKSVISATLGAHGQLQSDLGSLIELPTGKTPRQAEKEANERFKDRTPPIPFESFEVPGFLPDVEEQRKNIEKISPTTKSKDKEEEREDERNETLVSLMGPGSGRSVPNKLIRAVLGSFGEKKVGEMMDEAGADPKAQAFVKGIVRVVSQLGRTSPHLNPKDMTAEQRKIYKAGKAAKLSEEETTLLIQGEKKARQIGSRTTETAANRATLKRAKEGAEAFINDLERKGARIDIPATETRGLANDAKALRSQLKREFGQAPQNKGVIDYLNTVIKDLEAPGPHQADKLIRMYRSINRMFSETRPTQRNLLQTINKRIARSLRRIDPKLGEEFVQGNTLHKARMDFMHNVGWETLEQAQSRGAPAQSWLAGVFGAAAGSLLGNAHVGAGLGLATSKATKYASNWVYNQLLTNPRWQNILRSSERALKEDSPKLAYTTMNLVKDRVRKENPEAYKNIDWPDD